MTILSYIPPFIAIMLALAGVPAFIALYNATQDLTTSILLTAIYEILVVIGSFLARVWQKLEGKWTERLSELIDNTVVEFFSHYGMCQ